MDLYARDIYGIIEAKLDEMIYILEELGMLKIANDQDGLPKVLVMGNIDAVRSLFISIIQKNI
jgi:hypothetical protein